MNVNMDAEARASLRHFLSAALIFGASWNDGRDARTRALEAFDEWFALADSCPPSSDGLDEAAFLERMEHNVDIRNASVAGCPVSGGKR